MATAPSDVTSLVNTETYRNWRSPEINELELSVWSADMFKYGISTSYESYGSLKTAIRRGVPDIIKHYIWIKANGADRFYMEHPNFYKYSFHTTFGLNVPELLGEDCPTFCGGILGLQSDILGTPVKAKDLDLNACTMDRKQSKGLGYSCGRLSEAPPKNQWGLDADGMEPLRRELSTLSLRDDYDNPRRKLFGGKGVSQGIGDGISRFRSDYDILEEKKNILLPDVIEESPEFARRDSIDTCLSVLHAENRNQLMLLKTTKKKIRERTQSNVIADRDNNKQRQYSDTFLLTKNSSLPGPPKHHWDIVCGNSSLTKTPESEEAFSAETCMIIQMLKDREQQPRLTQVDVSAPKYSKFKTFVKWLCKRCGVRNDVEEHYPSIKTRVFNEKDVESVVPEIDDSVYTSGASSYNKKSIYGSEPIQNASEPEANDDGYYIFPSSAAETALVRQATQNVLHSSVYKLSDVTDFTSLLTPHGVSEVKRILWCLNTSFSTKIEFMPIIPSLCCLLLVYMTPEAAICVLHCLMIKALEKGNLECGQRFMFIDREGFVNFVKYVHSITNYQHRKLIAKMQLLKVDVAAWIARAVQTGFSHLLPFDFILRIYGDFLFEGEIVLCRYCVALVKYAHDKLIKCNTQVEAEETLYRIGLDPELEIDQLTKLAYSFRLKYYKSEIKGGATTPYLMPVKIKNFYRPRLSTTSAIVKEHKWETIWTWLLPAYRILDPKKVYSSEQHGTTLLGLIKTIKESGGDGVAALLYIQTTANDIFGVFIPSLSSYATDGLFTSTKASDQLSSFVFTLKPDEEIYKWSGKNNNGVKLGAQQIVIGNDSPALILDKTMSRGLSQECASYLSPSLVTSPNGYFDVLRVELWYLV